MKIYIAQFASINDLDTNEEYDLELLASPQVALAAQELDTKFIWLVREAAMAAYLEACDEDDDTPALTWELGQLDTPAEGRPNYTMRAVDTYGETYVMAVIQEIELS